MKAIWILGLLVLSLQAQAQFIHPEYQTLSEERVKNFYDASDVTMEYESDFMHYLPSFSHLSNYYQNRNSFVASVGSLGKKNFMIRQAAKFQAPLGERIDFGFVQFGEEDFESQHRGIIFEFLFWTPDHEKALVIFGETSYLKGEDDIGVAFEVNKHTSRSRLYATFSEFSRNERGIGNDEIQDTPFALGYLWESFDSDTEFSRLNISWQFQTQWDFPSESASYRYRQGQFQFLKRSEVKPGIYGNRLIYLEEVFQKRIAAFNKERRVFRISESREKERLEAGLWYAHHYFKFNTSRLQYNFVQPFVWFSNRGPEADQRWRYGVSVVVGDRDDGDTGFLPEDSGDEFRLSVMWQTKLYELHLGFDLDRIGQSDMWEGGSMKVQASF